MKKTMILAVVTAMAFASAASVLAADQNQGLRNQATAPAKPQALQTPGPVQKHATKKWGRKEETSGVPHCTKGKPCGKSCIAMDKICHK